MKNRKKYITVVLGGTFDHFHDGHKAFIDAAANMGQRLIIGVSSKKLLHNKKYRFSIEPLKVRFRSVGNYCKKQGYSIELVELHDIYGPTIDPDIKQDALFVTTETAAGADKINVVREQLGLKSLPVHIVNMVPAEDGQPIHSDRIRAGEISRGGFVYSAALANTITLSEPQRKALSKLQGKIVNQPDSRPSYKIVVGDSTLERFNSFEWEYNLGIFDGICERETYHSNIINALSVSANVSNPAGSISSEASRVISQFCTDQKDGHIQVDGEEDLLAIPAVLSAPLGSFVYYGQPGVGGVEIEVTEKIKDHFIKILNQ
ncbi:MAG: pantetheine-phosphate adenylyltransferase [Pseudomonadales bacterium]|nr:pantetheine-phosphate adenylyltransferase [Pseudomonadales bacterium]